MTDVHRTILELAEQGRQGVLVTVIAVDGHTPQVVGAKMIVQPDGAPIGTIGGGRVEHEVIARALECLETGRPALHTFRLKAELGMCCGGQMEIFLEPLRVPERLVLFGAGHVAHALARAAAPCGFELIVIDERADWNTLERFPTARARRVEPVEDALADLALRDTDYVVIATHNHDYDRQILGAVLGTPADYVGMIGSTRKVQKTFRQLQLEGLEERALSRVHAPIGLDILAETPEEIAVAIIGELIRHRRQRGSTKKTRGAAIASRSTRTEG